MEQNLMREIRGSILQLEPKVLEGRSEPARPVF